LCFAFFVSLWNFLLVPFLYERKPSQRLLASGRLSFFLQSTFAFRATAKKPRSPRSCGRAVLRPFKTCRQMITPCRCALIRTSPISYKTLEKRRRIFLPFEKALLIACPLLTKAFFVFPFTALESFFLVSSSFSYPSSVFFFFWKNFFHPVLPFFVSFLPSSFPRRIILDFSLSSCCPFSFVRLTPIFFPALSGIVHH